MCVHTDVPVCIFVCFYMCVKLFLYMHSDTMNTTHQARSETMPNIGPGLFFVGDSMDDVIPIIHRSVSVARLRYVALLPLAPCCKVGSCSDNPFTCRGRHYVNKM